MLETGSTAPDFTLPNQLNEEITLSMFKDNWIILYFYPKDMTPGCTKEANSFQELYEEFSKLKTVIIGISKDSVERHKKFADKNNIKFNLLSDENSNVCETYEVWQKKKMYGKEFMGIVRSTYIINPQGKIVKVYPKVKVKEHTEEVLGYLKENI